MFLASMRSLSLRCRAAAFSTRSLATIAAKQEKRGAETMHHCNVTDGMLHVAWPDGVRGRHPLLWLRAFCPADAVSTGQRIRNIGDFYGNVAIVSAQITGNDEVRVQWADGHSSVFQREWLMKHALQQDPHASQFHRSAHRRVLTAHSTLPEVLYEAFMETEDGFFAVLEHMCLSGLCILKNVPVQARMVKQVAEKIAPISYNLLYGDVWDVKPTTNAVNIAYTSLPLRLHMDLVYYDTPPGFQLLHCLANDELIRGGQSTFMDGIAAAEELQFRDPESFRTLCSVMATFQKVRDGTSNGKWGSDRAVHMVCRRPHIELDPESDQVQRLYWAPPFEGPVRCTPEQFERYSKAYTSFQRLIEDSDFSKSHTIKFRLQPGDLVLFDNCRMLHGREGFHGDVPDAQRHLQGTYLNSDDVFSTFTALANKRHTK